MFFSQNFAKKLVNADRTALFLVDQRTRELYARVFDMGEEYDESRAQAQRTQKEIRCGPHLKRQPSGLVGFS